MGNRTPGHFIGLKHLLVKHAECLARNPGNPYAATLNTTLAIITHWMGRDWIERALHPKKNNKRRSPLKLEADPDDAIKNIAILRLRAFAEDLFNLQYIDGFHALIERLRKMPDIESSWAELQAGRLLYAHGVDFKFVAAGGTAGEDYDLEIRARGQMICGETKCKISAGILKAASLTRDIQKAAKEQLPSDRPGILFVSIPQNWVEVDDRTAVELETIRAAEVALRSYSRLVSVILYTATLSHDGTEALEGLFHKEVPNPNHKFPGFPNGELLRYRPSGRYWDHMPPKWLRLYDLPYGVLGEYRHEKE